MPNPAQPMVAELDQEAVATRRLLERVPGEKLAWKPHPRAMSLGQLAVHVARIPGSIARMAKTEGIDVSAVNFEPPQPQDVRDLLPELEAGLAEARSLLSGLDEARAGQIWKLSFGDREVFSVPRLSMIRSLMLNHWYHHRGQLAVYLRILDLPVPATYGRSADEIAFA